MYRLTAVAIVSLAACLWSAIVAFGWGVAEVPNTAGSFTSTTLVAGRDGTTLIGLLDSRGLGVSRVAGGAPSAPVLLRAATTPFGESGWLAFAPRRRLVAVGTESSSRGQRVWLAEGPPGGPLGPERTIARRATSTAFAASTRGDVAVAVSMTNDSGSGVLRAMVRNARGAVRSYNIIRGRQGPFGLAFNHRGDLLVVGSLVRETDPLSDAAGYTLAARLLPASGRPGRLRRVARVHSSLDDSGAPSVHVALGDDRRALVGWDLLPCGAGGGCGPSALGFAAAGTARPREPSAHPRRSGTGRSASARQSLCSFIQSPDDPWPRRPQSAAPTASTAPSYSRAAREKWAMLRAPANASPRLTRRVS